jgi:hypothetical protein
LNSVRNDTSGRLFGFAGTAACWLTGAVPAESDEPAKGD